MSKISYSIIIPVRKIGDFITKENLPSFEKLSLINFEVILLPNSKSSIDKILLEKYRWLKIIATHKITRPAQKRNIGAEKSEGEILAFIDDDAYTSPKWLTKANEIFKNNKIDAVCGPGVLPPNTNLWEKTFDQILNSNLGSGGFTYRFTKQKARYVDDFPSMNFLIRKKIFLGLGGFDNDYWPGEDSKLCEMLVYKNRGLIFYHPDVFIYHHRRNNLRDFLRQHSQYGFHRGAFYSHGDKNSKSIVYFIPSIFILYLICIAVFTGLNQFNFNIFYYISLLPLIFYFVAILINSSIATIKSKNVWIGILSIGVMFFMHLVYGLYFLKGVFVGWHKKESIY